MEESRDRIEMTKDEYIEKLEDLIGILLNKIGNDLSYSGVYRVYQNAYLKLLYEVKDGFSYTSEKE